MHLHLHSHLHRSSFIRHLTGAFRQSELGTGEDRENQRVAAARRVLDVAARRRVRDFGGLPPSIPFKRDEIAFRFDRTDPRHAGQNETKSIL